MASSDEQKAIGRVMRVRSTHCTNQELFLNGRAMSGDANCTYMAINCQKCRPDPTILQKSFDLPAHFSSHL